MAHAKKALRIVYPETQKYACRDCPARCCRTPWGIPVAPEVALVLLNDEELRARLVGRAPGVLADGTLPMRERERVLQCVFLDDDELCAVQKRHGHAALPRACQAYPFGFVHDEQGREVALLSRHCPSIRDDYGEPLSEQIEAKWQQAGGSRSLAPRMGLASGRTLPLEQYLRVVDSWKQLILAESPLDGLISAYFSMAAFDEHLPDRPSDQVVRVTLEATTARLATPLVARSRPTFAARLFYSHQLGSLCYPSRVLTPFATARPTWWQRLGSYGNRLAWLVERGRVDLLHVPAPIPLARIRQVPPFLGGPLGALVRDYVVELIERRQAFVQSTYLSRALVDWVLAVALVSRFARASALGHGRTEVARSDVQEGIGVADLLLAHQADASQTVVLANLRLQLMSDGDALRRFVASEVG